MTFLRDSVGAGVMGREMSGGAFVLLIALMQLAGKV
jgi:hypothetical protein